MLPEAWAIVESQPKTSERIFPYKAQSIGEAFRRARKLLGISNLRFHDLRHEATSRFSSVATCFRRSSSLRFTSLGPH